MNIIINDEQGLGMALMMERYSQAQIQAAKETIRRQFKEAATTVFAEVLNRPLPENIVVDLAQNTNEELSGEKGAVLASFNSELSRSDRLIFTVREKTVKSAMEQCDDESFRATVLHEMLHAADLPVLSKNRQLLNDLQNDYSAHASDFFTKEEADGVESLFDTLHVFEHYRDEGIAILGEHLLTKRQFEISDDALWRFNRIYQLTMIKSKSKAKGGLAFGEIFDDAAFSEAYDVAPSVLLLVLARRGNLEKELVARASECLNTGTFTLTEEETKTIVKSSMSLSLSEYIQGVVSLGEVVAPAKPFLEFCALLQRDWEDDNIKAFSNLLSQQQTKDVFNKAMQQIMGCTMSEQAIDSHFQALREQSSDMSLYPKMIEKAETLYDVLKNDKDAGKRRIAQWALTYLFDDQDVIHDDIKGLGYVDDMAVMDYALNLITSAS